MSVTIDSLDIQIKASAASAKKEIDELAASLEKLKKSSGIDKTTKALGDLGKAAKNASSKLDFSLGIHQLQSLVVGVNKLANSISKVTNDAMQWDGISFRFGKAFGEDAQEVYDWVLKLEGALRINSQQFMQYSSMFGTILKGFGLEQDKVTTMAVGLTELSYDIWAENNDRYESLESAYEAVRSAITGEIEPIRNAGIALTQASMQEYLDSVGLASVKVANLSEAQKSLVRYAVMANAATAKGTVGTYAREMNTAEGAVRAFTQQMKGLAQAFGSLLVPAITTVITWVSAFVSILHSAITAIANLFGITKSVDSGGIGSIADSASDAEAALGGAGGAAKKLKDYMMGFDELNVINPDTGGGGGGGGGSALDGLELPDLKKLWDESTLKQATDQVETLKQKILDFFDKWGVAIAVVSGALALLAGWSVFKGSPLEKFIKTLGASGFASAVESVSKSLGKLGRPLTNMSGLFGKIVTAVKTFIATAGGGTLAAIAAAVVAVGSAAYFLYENWDTVVASVKEFCEVNIAPHMESIKRNLEPLAPLFEKVSLFVKDLVAWFKALDWGVLLEGFAKLGEIIVVVVLNVVLAAIRDLIATIDLLITAGVKLYKGVVDIGESIKAWWNSNMAPLLTREHWEGVFDNICTAVNTKLEETKKTIAEKWQGIKSWWDSNVAPKFTKTYWMNKFDVIRSAIREKIEAAKGALQEKWAEIKAWFDSTVAPMLELSYWTGKLNMFLDFGRTIVENIKAGLTEKWEELVEWWKNLELPSFRVKIPTFSISGLFDGNAGTVPTIKVDWKVVEFANGGFPDMGQMFIAREAGPELVGSINGRTAVANNDQIVAAVSQGVYEAVRSAMSGQNDSESSFNVNVFLDSKQITAAVEKRQRERGVAMMTGGVAFA